MKCTQNLYKWVQIIKMAAIYSPGFKSPSGDYYQQASEKDSSGKTKSSWSYGSKGTTTKIYSGSGGSSKVTITKKDISNKVVSTKTTTPSSTNIDVESSSSSSPSSSTKYLLQTKSGDVEVSKKFYDKASSSLKGNDPYYTGQKIFVDPATAQGQSFNQPRFVSVSGGKGFEVPQKKQTILAYKKSSVEANLNLEDSFNAQQIKTPVFDGQKKSFYDPNVEKNVRSVGNRGVQDNFAQKSYGADPNKVKQLYGKSLEINTEPISKFKSFDNKFKNNFVVKGFQTGFDRVQQAPGKVGAGYTNKLSELDTRYGNKLPKIPQKVFDTVKQEYPKSSLSKFFPTIPVAGTDFVGGAYEGVRTKPATTISNVAIGAITAPLFGAAPTVVKYGATVLYGSSVGVRLYQAPKDEKISKAGEIAGTELVPFMLGAKAYSSTKVAVSKTKLKFKGRSPFENEAVHQQSMKLGSKKSMVDKGIYKEAKIERVRSLVSQKVFTPDKGGVAESFTLQKGGSIRGETITAGKLYTYKGQPKLSLAFQKGKGYVHVTKTSTGSNVKFRSETGKITKQYNVNQEKPSPQINKVFSKSSKQLINKPGYLESIQKKVNVYYGKIQSKIGGRIKTSSVTRKKTVTTTDIIEAGRPTQLSKRVGADLQETHTSVYGKKPKIKLANKEAQLPSNTKISRLHSNEITQEVLLNPKIKSFHTRKTQFTTQINYGETSKFGTLKKGASDLLKFKKGQFQFTKSDNKVSIKSPTFGIPKTRFGETNLNMMVDAIKLPQTKPLLYIPFSLSKHSTILNNEQVNITKIKFDTDTNKRYETKSFSANKINFRTATIFKTKETTIQSPLLKQDQKQTTKSRYDSIQQDLEPSLIIKKPSTYYKFEIPEVPPPEKPPKLGLPLISFGAGSRNKKFSKIKGITFSKYNPSLVAVAYNIRGKIPTNLGGLELRPIKG